MPASDFVSESVVLSEQFLDSLFVGVGFLGSLSVFISVLIEFIVQLRDLGCRESEVLLESLDFTSQSSYFIVLLLDY